MTRHTYTTTIELYISGHPSDRECDCAYEYTGPDGDGWNEPRIPASVSLEAVEVMGDTGRAVDLLALGLISDKALSELEREILADHTARMKPDPDDWRDEMCDRAFDHSY